MKLLFVADLHLGASYKALSLEKQRARKSEVFNAISSIFEKAKLCGAEAILFGGDVFHSNAKNKQTQKYLFNLIEQSDINCFMIFGNHDEKIVLENLPQNLTVILGQPQSFELGQDVVLTAFPYNYSDFSCLQSLKSESFNIVMMHGDIFNSSDKSFINTTLLKNKNIDILALGHLHDFMVNKLDERGQVFYSGCTFGNGFDECGTKGDALIDTQTSYIEFIPLACRMFHEVDVDISDFESLQNLESMIEKSFEQFDRDDFVKVNLIGRFNEGQDKFLEVLRRRYSDLFFFFELVDKSRLKIDLQKIATEKLSFKYEFLRLVNLDESLTDDEKNAISILGVEALSGEEVGI